MRFPCCVRVVRLFRCASSWARSPSNQTEFFAKIIGRFKPVINYQNHSSNLVTTLVMVTKRTTFDTLTCKRTSVGSISSIEHFFCLDLKLFWTQTSSTFSPPVIDYVKLAKSKAETSSSSAYPINVFFTLDKIFL